MGFKLVVEGQIVDSEQAQVEQKEGLISNAFRGVLAQFSNDITLATATFDYAGEQDLTPTPSEPGSGGGGGQPVFQTKTQDDVDAADPFEHYKERLFTWNGDAANVQVPSEQQYGDDRKAEWEALPVG